MQYNNSNDSIWKKVIRFIGFSNKQLSQEDIFEHDLTREEELFGLLKSGIGWIKH